MSKKCEFCLREGLNLRFKRLKIKRVRQLPCNFVKPLNNPVLISRICKSCWMKRYVLFRAKNTETTKSQITGWLPPPGWFSVEEVSKRIGYSQPTIRGDIFKTERAYGKKKAPFQFYREDRGDKMSSKLWLHLDSYVAWRTKRYGTIVPYEERKRV